ncbi:hypothetical protein [Dactylosporangium sp. NPDC000521]|uniref:hypothetical protein n=1 Tax=Dactylosporangium sp. NPDC000521 TaxID=3363975 RepID=UPI003692478C
MSTDDHEPAEWTVRGLAVPSALVVLMEAGAWRDPDPAALHEVMPWFADPLVFLTSIEWMRRENRSLDLFPRQASLSALFRTARGSRTAGRVELPWLDVEQAILIAVNRNPGDDVAVALDLRTSPADPAVVASDFWSDPRQCHWRPVTPTFTEFATRLHLT